MKEKFFKQIERLADKKPNMKQAVRNVKKDCQDNGNPHGNIKETVTESICKGCAGYSRDETAHLLDILNIHQSINSPELYTPAPSPHDNEPLRHVRSLTSFVAYHMIGRIPGEYDDLSDRKHYNEYIRERFDRNGNEIELEIEELNGTIGSSENNLAWWTFYRDGKDGAKGLPTNCETYMMELALGEHELNQIKEDKIGVEVSVNVKDLKHKLYKPTALDSFEPDTRFRPELSGLPYGLTCPQEDGLNPRPELVSRRVRYPEDIDADNVRIKKLPCRRLRVVK